MPKQINPGRKMNKPCVICGEDRYTEKCHIIPAECDSALKRLKMYNANLIILCPTHHVCFDDGLLTQGEFSKIAEQVYMVVYKYVTSHRRLEKRIKNKMSNCNYNCNGSVFDIDKFRSKIDRGLLRKGWLNSLISNN